MLLRKNSGIGKEKIRKVCFGDVRCLFWEEQVFCFLCAVPVVKKPLGVNVFSKDTWW